MLIDPSPACWVTGGFHVQWLRCLEMMSLSSYIVAFDAGVASCMMGSICIGAC